MSNSIKVNFMETLCKLYGNKPILRGCLGLSYTPSSSGPSCWGCSSVTVRGADPERDLLPFPGEIPEHGEMFLPLGKRPRWVGATQHDGAGLRRKRSAQVTARCRVHRWFSACGLQISQAL